MPKRWLCRCKEEENYNNQIVVAKMLLIALITLVTQGEAEEVLKRSEESLHVVSRQKVLFKETNICPGVCGSRTIFQRKTSCGSLHKSVFLCWQVEYFAPTHPTTYLTFPPPVLPAT